MTSVRPYMHKEPKTYKVLLEKMLTLIIDMCHDPNLEKQRQDPKFLSQLRIAERTFNFFLDNFPLAEIRNVFSGNEWEMMKKNRDHAAKLIADLISKDPVMLTRYQDFCENLKDPYKLGFLL